MKARPILMNGDMVRAVLEGRKTQTRRVVKGQLPNNRVEVKHGGKWVYMHVQDARLNCPYGQPGDLLYVREKFQPIFDEGFEHESEDRPDYETGHGYSVSYPATHGIQEFVNADDELSDRCWPSIHMPRWASRITLEITNVRVERLQDIGEEDAKAEGVHTDYDYPTESQCPACRGQGVHGSVGKSLGWIEVDCIKCDSPQKRFRNIWDSIYGTWDANPWVWVVEFRPHMKNVDEVMRDRA